MFIFTEASILIKAVEAHLVSEVDSDILLFGYVKRLIWLPAKFLKMGVAEKIQGVFVWAFLSIVFMVLGLYAANHSDVNKTETVNLVMFSSITAPLFLVAFAMPSMYGASGVTKETVFFVVKHLQTRGFSNVIEIELLKKTIKPVEDRCRTRLNALKWVAGLLWAGALYFFSRSIDQFLLDPGHFLIYALPSAGFLIVLLAAYLCVWGYEAAVDKLFRAIEFGCNEFCHVIQLPVVNSR